MELSGIWIWGVCSAENEGDVFYGTCKKCGNSWANKTQVGVLVPQASIFQYPDGLWGWLDETWNPGDDKHYATKEEAQAAQSKYCTEVLDPAVREATNESDIATNLRALLKQWDEGKLCKAEFEALAREAVKPS